MLRISKKADYALSFLGHIARNGAYPGGKNPERVISAQSIADQTGLHKSVVANLLKDLTKDGVLTSTRGLKGGYRLAIHPGDVSFKRVLAVVDGPFQLVECCGPDGADADAPPALDGAVAPDGGGDEETGHACGLIAFCPSRNPMQLVNQRLDALLESLRLDELCGLTPPRIPASLHHSPTVSSGSPKR